ncbi:Crp/Fnr family transcriptional regulator [Rhodobacteraceae bacterium NNCM2]|nr:Crp/Fnr family transcriptional regulator [Coraliihabitans acroporae]
MAEHWTESTFQARSLIVSEDEQEDDVYFIISGKARAATYTNNGKEVLMSELPPGEGFGIFAAIDGLPRSTNVIAISECRVARMSAANYNHVMDTNTQVMRAFLVYMVDRIRHLSIRMTNVTTMNAEQRLVYELLELGKTNMTGDDVAVIDPVPTQQELAILIAGQRESVGRDMSKLSHCGLIEREGRTLTIPSMDRLEDYLYAE